MNDDDKLIGSAKAAKLLGIKRPTLYQWTSSKLIQFDRISRCLIQFDPVELQSWIEARRIQAIGTKPEKRQTPTRRGSKPEIKRATHAADMEPPARPARESPKDRPKDGKTGGSRKATEWRAWAHTMEMMQRERKRRRKRRA